jgi:hypothetical protein
MNECNIFEAKFSSGEIKMVHSCERESDKIREKTTVEKDMNEERIKREN